MGTRQRHLFPLGTVAHIYFFCESGEGGVDVYFFLRGECEDFPSSRGTVVYNHSIPFLSIRENKKSPEPETKGKRGVGRLCTFSGADTGLPRHTRHHLWNRVHIDISSIRCLVKIHLKSYTIPTYLYEHSYY